MILCFDHVRASNRLGVTAIFYCMGYRRSRTDSLTSSSVKHVHTVHIGLITGMDTTPPRALIHAPATPPRRAGPRPPPTSPLSPSSSALLDSVLEYEAVRRLKTKRILQRSREKRKGMHAAMQKQREVLEIVAVNVGPALQRAEDDDADSETARIRRFLRNSKALLEEQKHEERVRDVLLKRLRVHATSVAAVTKMIHGVSVDSWFWSCERWAAMTREHYTRWTMSRYEYVMEESVKLMAEFKVPVDRMASSPVFFGWQYYYYMKEDRGFFSYQKVHKRPDIDLFAEAVWTLYREAERFMKYVSSQPMNQNRSYHRVLQRISPDMFILQTLDQLPGIEGTFHNVSLVFRFETKSGWRIVLRSIPMRALDEVMRGDGVFTLSDFYWLDWAVTERDANGNCCEFSFSFSGSVCSEQRREYAQWWLPEILLRLVKAEALVGGFQPLWIAT